MFSWRPGAWLSKTYFLTDFLQHNNLRYDAELHIGEDYMLFAEALACGAICAVDPHAGYLYTIRKGSTSYRLSLNDIIRITHSDKKLLAHYTFNAAVAKALKDRQFHLNEAYAYTKLVDAIKQQNILGAIKALKISPMAILQLWRPFWVHLKKMTPHV